MRVERTGGNTYLLSGGVQTKSPSFSATARGGGKQIDQFGDAVLGLRELFLRTSPAGGRGHHEGRFGDEKGDRGVQVGRLVIGEHHRDLQ